MAIKNGERARAVTRFPALSSFGWKFVTTILITGQCHMRYPRPQATPVGISGNKYEQPKDPMERVESGPEAEEKVKGFFFFRLSYRPHVEFCRSLLYPH